MLQSKIVWVLMLTIGSLQAVDISPNVEKSIFRDSEDKKVIKNQAEEIVVLKKKIRQLESELIDKGIKPIELEVEKMKVVQSPPKFFKGARMTIGGEAPEYLTAYYTASPQTINGLKTKLEANGFTVLASTAILNEKYVLTITNEELQKTNTFLATLQVFVNGENEVLVQNPSYFGAAYLQDKYKYGQFSLTLKALHEALGGMHEVDDKFEFDDLAKYHFMFGMPYVEDTITVGKGNDLLEKVMSENVSNHIAYTLKLPNSAVIVGHKLQSSTNQFFKKIEAERKMNILPYESMIKEGKAVMLDPKYYLALSLPLLHMSDFMKIASTPEEIEKDIKRAYK